MYYGVSYTDLFVYITNRYGMVLNPRQSVVRSKQDGHLHFVLRPEENTAHRKDI